ncbi:hypothetical protein BKI52_33990 [marine bacterium AO1-C]|nr:hypothetical protein BKI52_33990 [marine bacterium AO1-C]
MRAILIAALFLVISFASQAQKDYQKLYNDIVAASQKKDYKTAIKLSEEMLPDAEKVLGKDSKNLGSFYYSVAGFYQANRQFDKAEKLYEQSLAVRKVAVGEKHPSYFKTQRKLATLYYASQKTEKAANLFKQILEAQKNAGLDKSKEYALTLYNLANLNFSLGKIKDSEQYYQQALALQKETVGDKNPEYLNTLERLAFLYSQQGDYPKAEPLFKQIWQTYKSTVNNGNPNYIRAVGNLAEIYFAIGKYQEAGPLYDETTQLLKATKSPLYGRFLVSYAILKEIQDNYASAEKLYQEAIEVLKKDVGESHPHYAQALHDFGKFNEIKEDYPKAQDLMQQAQKIRKQALGINHPKYAESLNDLAKLYFKMGRLNIALENCQKALNIRQKGNDRIAVVTTIRNLANIYRAMQRINDAERHYKTALAEQEKIQGKLHKEYLTTLNSLGEMYDAANRLREAQETYKQVRTARAKTLGTNHRDYLLTSYNLAMAYLADDNKIDSAYQLMLQLERNETFLQKMPRIYANILRNLGGFFYQQGKVEEAKIRFSKGLKIYPRRDESYIHFINSLAASYAESGAYTAADSLYDAARKLSLDKYGKDSEIYAITLNESGKLYEQSGRYQEAVHNYQEALRIAKKIKGANSAQYATALHDLGVVFKAMGKYVESEQSFEKARDIRKAKLGPNSYAYSVTLNDMGNLYKVMGRFADAEKYYVQALNIRKKTLGVNHFEYAVSLNDLAGLYRKQGKTKEARKLYEQALQIRKTELGENHPDYAVSLDNLASMFRSEGNREKAEEYYIRALEIRGVVLGNKHPAYAASLNNLAVFYEEVGKMEEAEQAYKQTVDIFKDRLGENHPDYGMTLANLAAFYEARNKFTEADQYFTQAVKIVLNQIDKTFSALSEEEKKQFYQVNKRFIDGFMRFAFNSAGLRASKGQADLPILGEAYNLQLATKALILNSTTKVRKRIMASGNQALINKYNQWQKIREQISNLYNLGQAELTRKGIKVKDLENKANQLERELSTKAEGFKGAYNPSLPTWKDVQKRLKPGEAAIEMIRLKTLKDSIYYSVLIVKPNTKNHPEFLTIRGGKDLESKYVAYYKNAVKFRRVDRYSYLKFWKPLKQALKGVKKVYISPDGVYNQVNLNTMTDPNTGKFVIDEIEIAMVTNTRDLLEYGNRNTNRKQAVLLGHPTYHINPKSVIRAGTKKTNLDEQTDSWLRHAYFSDLPGTQVEVEGINQVLGKKRWKTTIHLGAKAREDSLKTVNNPDILHIATHGFFIPSLNDQQSDSRGVKIKPSKKKKKDENEGDNDPMLRSGLILAGVTDYFNASEKPNSDDGVLTAYEAMNLQLDQTDLVVLSACETGLGKVQSGEGVYGLQRALKIAGARTILMSLWKVSDEATQKLMNVFYDEWLKSGNKRDAFQKAQQQIRQEYKHPYYWGAFVMVGE